MEDVLRRADDDGRQSLSGSARDALLLLATLGLRLREGLGLSWSEIDLRGAKVALAATRMKNDEPHVLPLPPRLMKLLKARRQAVPD